MAWDCKPIFESDLKPANETELRLICFFKASDMQGNSLNVLDRTIEDSEKIFNHITRNGELKIDGKANEATSIVSALTPFLSSIASGANAGCGHRHCRGDVFKELDRYDAEAYGFWGTKPESTSDGAAEQTAGNVSPEQPKEV